MQLKVSREALLRPLQLVSGALGGRPTLPILGNVLLDVSNGLLSLTGTDLEVEMIGQVYLSNDSQDGRTTCRRASCWTSVAVCRRAEIRQHRGDSAHHPFGRSRFNLLDPAGDRIPEHRGWGPCSSSTSASWS